MKKLLLLLVATFGVANCSDLDENFLLGIGARVRQDFETTKQYVEKQRRENVIANLKGLGLLSGANASLESTIRTGFTSIKNDDPEWGKYNVQIKTDNNQIIATAEVNGETYNLGKKVYFSQGYIGSTGKAVLCIAAAAGAYYCYQNPEKAQGMWNSFTNWASNTWTDLVNKLK